MADNNDISQFIVEVANEGGTDQISQSIVESLASTGVDEISQLIVEVAPTTGNDQISQLTIELLRGPDVTPPADSPTGTFVFNGGGDGVSYYLVPQLSDSGVELRDKVVKPFHVTGKITSPLAKIYGYGPQENIDVDAIEAGTGFKAIVVLDTTTQVALSKRHPVNCPNLRVHTIRIEGRWDGTGDRDRIDEIVYEQAISGVRR